jgi:hypothetical protein
MDNMVIGVHISQMRFYVLAGIVDDVIKRLLEDEARVKRKHPQYSNIRLDLSVGDDGRELWFIGDRPMTEEEIAKKKRVARARSEVT